MNEQSIRAAAAGTTADEQSFNQVEFRKDIDRAIAKHKPDRGELKSAMDRVLAWYGFRIT
ncbi:hypothetical protein [Paenibacillus elgii]|uniref:hypothetical protein n=1 Tax=Paenibacillus elgii TaxID=189691 RepID=UPI0013D800B3|nr:hypothetical protein [Paenibacillus elgii]